MTVAMPSMDLIRLEKRIKNLKSRGAKKMAFRYELLPFKNDVAVILTDYAVFDTAINEVIFESDREDCEAFIQSLVAPQ
jgi:hypothetical protein